MGNMSSIDDMCSIGNMGSMNEIHIFKKMNNKSIGKTDALS
jgi:hypothetical protein